MSSPDPLRYALYKMNPNLTQAMVNLFNHPAFLYVKRHFAASLMQSFPEAVLIRPSSISRGSYPPGEEITRFGRRLNSSDRVFTIHFEGKKHLFAIDQNGEVLTYAVNSRWVGIVKKILAGSEVVVDTILHEHAVSRMEDYAAVFPQRAKEFGLNLEHLTLLQTREIAAKLLPFYDKLKCLYDYFPKLDDDGRDMVARLGLETIEALYSEVFTGEVSVVLDKKLIPDLVSIVTSNVGFFQRKPSENVEADADAKLDVEMMLKR